MPHSAVEYEIGFIFNIEGGKVAFLERDPAPGEDLRPRVAVAAADAPHLLLRRDVEKHLQICVITEARMQRISPLDDAPRRALHFAPCAVIHGRAVEDPVLERLRFFELRQHLGGEAFVVDVAAGFVVAFGRAQRRGQKEVVHVHDSGVEYRGELARQSSFSRSGATVDCDNLDRAGGQRRQAFHIRLSVSGDASARSHLLTACLDKPNLSASSS